LRVLYGKVECMILVGGVVSQHVYCNGAVFEPSTPMHYG